MNLAVKLDMGGVDQALVKLLADDLPFTIARFLTMEAQDGQAAAREEERRVFRLRNDWTVRNTKITPARKTSLFAEVYTDTSNYKTGAGDYLPRQEEGGEKVPLAGHSFLAIPTRYLRRIVPGVIPDSVRPRNLLPPDVQIGETYTGSFVTKGVRPKRALGREARKKLASNEYQAFVQKTKGGTLCIFVKHGGIGYNAGRDGEPWYTLVHEAHIKPRFPMEQVVKAVVEANMDKNFDRAAAEVLVNNALRGGLRVRF